MNERAASTPWKDNPALELSVKKGEIAKSEMCGCVVRIQRVCGRERLIRGQRKGAQPREGVAFCDIVAAFFARHASQLSKIDRHQNVSSQALLTSHFGESFVCFEHERKLRVGKRRRIVEFESALRVPVGLLGASQHKR